MIRRQLLSCLAALLAVAPFCAMAEERPGLEIAIAQFPAPRSDETEREWRYFRFSYANQYLPAMSLFEPPREMTPTGPALRVPETQLYSEFDAQGRPMWFGGSRDVDLRTLIVALLREDKFETLEKLLDEWEQGAERTADGKWKLDCFFEALDMLFDDRWNEGYQRIGRWRAQRRKSPLAAIAEARFWQSFAWKARGNGYFDTVDERARTVFYERSRKGEEALLASKSYASGHPLWGAVYLQLASGLQWSIDEQLKLFHLLTTANKDFYQYYATMTKYASPKWYGDWGLVDALARKAEAATKEKDGASLYARIYWSVWNNNRDIDFFHATRVDWPHMKRGFDDLMARYPHSVWNANHYAAFACAAGDGDSFVAMRRLIGDNIEKKAWPHGRTLEECDQKFPGGKAMTGAPPVRRAPTQLKAAFKRPAGEAQ